MEYLGLLFFLRWLKCCSSCECWMFIQFYVSQVQKMGLRYGLLSFWFFCYVLFWVCVHFMGIRFWILPIIIYSFLFFLLLVYAGGGSYEFSFRTNQYVQENYLLALLDFHGELDLWVAVVAMVQGSSLLPYLQITNVSSTFLSQMAGFKYSIRLTLRSSMNRLTRNVLLLYGPLLLVN